MTESMMDLVAIVFLFY